MNSYREVKTASNPFLGNVIALKEVKDKTTRKGSLRPLFDCIESINSAVDALQTFNEMAQDSDESNVISKFLESLTNMQIKLLEMSKEKIKNQNALTQDPFAASPEDAIDGSIQEADEMVLPEGSQETQTLNMGM